MTAYELRISDWSSDVCSSDLNGVDIYGKFAHPHKCNELLRPRQRWLRAFRLPRAHLARPTPDSGLEDRAAATSTLGALGRVTVPAKRSEEHTSELQSLMRISKAGFCLQLKTIHIRQNKINRKI